MASGDVRDPPPSIRTATGLASGWPGHAQLAHWLQCRFTYTVLGMAVAVCISISSVAPPRRRIMQQNVIIQTNLSFFYYIASLPSRSRSSLHRKHSHNLATCRLQWTDLSRQISILRPQERLHGWRQLPLERSNELRSAEQRPRRLLQPPLRVHPARSRCLHRTFRSPLRHHDRCIFQKRRERLSRLQRLKKSEQLFRHSATAIRDIVEETLHLT